MQVMMIRAKVHADAMDELRATAEQTFAAIHEAAPDGVRYATTVLPDGVSFVAFLALEDPEQNPLPQIPAFVEWQQAIPRWRDGEAEVVPLEVIASYQLF